ncbi:MAG: small basic protein [Planctomycetota bacterium]|nr:small basic protein [Planctomycetota bacterium]
MSIHPSLSGVNTLVGQRSVFTRVERLQKLMKAGKLSEEDSVYGLPKVRTHYKLKSKKKADEKAKDDAAKKAAE